MRRAARPVVSRMRCQDGSRVVALFIAAHCGLSLPSFRKAHPDDHRHRQHIWTLNHGACIVGISGSVHLAAGTARDFVTAPLPFVIRLVERNKHSSNLELLQSWFYKTALVFPSIRERACEEGEKRGEEGDISSTPKTHGSRDAPQAQGMQLTHAFGRGILLWQIVLRLRTALECMARDER